MCKTTCIHAWLFISARMSACVILCFKSVYYVYLFVRLSVLCLHVCETMRISVAITQLQKRGPAPWWPRPWWPRP